MMWYQVIEIRNLEPLKIGAGGNKAHWDEPCKDYIPGSTLRGGAIARLQRMGLFEDSKSILQQMECFNAYIYQDEQLYLPSPQHLRMDKHEYRRQRSLFDQGQTDGIVELANLFVTAESERAYVDSPMPHKNQLPVPYVTIRDGNIEGIKSRKSYRLHHSSLLNREQRERANLFSYQALEPGHVFRSVIAYQENIKTQAEAMWEGTDIWYLGGSKGSGYGRCRVKTVGEPQSDYEEVRSLLGMNSFKHAEGMPKKTNVLTLTCLSDVIIRGRYGEPMSYVPEEVLEKCCGMRLKSGSRHFVQTGLTEGYNATWKARYPKETTIKAGSVMRYLLDDEVDEPTLNKVIAALEQRRYGARTQEGYGWIAVNLPYPSRLQMESRLAVTGERRGQSDDVRPPSNVRSEETMLGESSTHVKSGVSADAHIAESIRLITKGLGDHRKRWLHMLSKKLIDTTTHDPIEELKINGLRSHHCRVMVDVLERWIKGQGVTISNAVRRQTYRQNNELFSLVDIHFDGILQFLENEHVSQEHEGLSRWAATKLNSSHGRIYYKGVDSLPQSTTEDIMNQKRFIAELICAALYIHQRSVTGEAISNEH